MTVATAQEDDGAADEPGGHDDAGPASTDVIVRYGFWIFLLSDIVMFSALFAAYAVLRGRTAGGPTGRQLFDLTRVAIETAFLLTSSFTCGVMILAAAAHRKAFAYAAAAFTLALGAAFLFLEVTEFAGMVAKGAGPSRSAFLSGFFTLVGAHGLHVSAGLIWLIIMVGQIATRGFRPTTMRRLTCFSLFWHALDIIWIAVFSIVYLMGVI